VGGTLLLLSVERNRFTVQACVTVGSCVTLGMTTAPRETRREVYRGKWKDAAFKSIAPDSDGGGRFPADIREA
jgi:hypothetical protein